MSETLVQSNHHGMHNTAQSSDEAPIMFSSNSYAYGSTSSNELYKEICRLQTYSSWPKPDTISGEYLARYGFYYIGSSDTVKCYFCLIELGGWEPGDEVIDEHLRWSPHCPLMTRRPTNNVPLDENFLDSLPERTSDTVGVSSQQQQSTVLLATDEPSISQPHITSPVSTVTYNSQVLAGVRGSSQAGHKHSRYVLPGDRLKTFEDWPTALTQKPDQMVEAGFFYTGRSDHVTCFSCGGRLKGWEPNDDPWQEHARYYSDCRYVQLHKSREFIERCQVREPPIERAIDTSTTRTGIEAASSAITSIKREGIEAAVSNDDPSASRLCKVCYENEFNTAFMPCGHVVACTRCASSVPRCPMCNESYTHVLRVYLP